MEVRLLAIREASGEPVNSPAKIFESMKPEARADRECLWVLHLNNKLQVIEKELVAMGTGNVAVVRPREVFRKAVICGATCIATVHNHPSGDLRPSADDLKVWETLTKAGKLLEIPVVDNLIIAPQGYYSHSEAEKRT